MAGAWETGDGFNSFCFLPMAHISLGFGVIGIDYLQEVFVEAV